MKWLIGVDEAGRGPLAGPVSVGAVLVDPNFDWDLIPGVGDSKKISAKNREVLFKRAKKLQKEGQLDYEVVLVSALRIDKDGIVPAIKSAVEKCLQKIERRNSIEHTVTHIRLDGSLRAPERYIYQETIIKGDSKEKCIGLASIMAKVTRDRHMERISTKYPVYGFEVHKGYGTKSHRELIMCHGLSIEHRRSFCGNLLK